MSCLFHPIFRSIKGFFVFMMSPAKFVAIEGRLKKCKNVITLGAKPNFFDYTADEQQLIRKADTIYYPSLFYPHRFYVSEGNMKYGKAGFEAAGVNYYRMMGEKLENGEI